ncbi:MAG TPA: DUF2946 family protein [Noviherbaspirillum sp.]|nr:DUF2946 family protein [Noviherbaspirillum sp.]
MFRQGKFQLSLVWTVLFAVLFNIALTALARSPEKSSLLTAEVCTSSGTKSFSGLGAKPAPGNHASLLHDGHCQLCPVGMAASPMRDVDIVLPIAARPAHESAPVPFVPVSPCKDGSPPPSQAPPLIS